MKWICLPWAFSTVFLNVHREDAIPSAVIPVPSVVFPPDPCAGLPPLTACALQKAQKVDAYCTANGEDPDCEDLVVCPECRPFGHCVQGRCVCQPGYAGDLCNISSHVTPEIRLQHPMILEPANSAGWFKPPPLPTLGHLTGGTPQPVEIPQFVSCEYSMQEVATTEQAIAAQTAKIIALEVAFKGCPPLPPMLLQLSTASGNGSVPQAECVHMQVELDAARLELQHLNRHLLVNKLEVDYHHCFIPAPAPAPAPAPGPAPAPAPAPAPL